MREYNGIDLVAISELLDDVHAFKVGHFTRDERHAQLMRVLLQREQVIAKDDDLVTARLVQILEVVARHVFGWVVEVQGLFQVMLVL